MLIREQQEEKRRRYWFIGTAGTGLALTVFSSAFLGVPLMAFGIYLGAKWLAFRAKWGMRF